MQAEVQAQDRTVFGWLTGFFKWFIWLFRRGGEVPMPTEPATANGTTYSVNGKVERETVVGGVSSKSDVLRADGVTAAKESRSAEYADSVTEGGTGNQSRTSGDEARRTSGEAPVREHADRGAVQKKRVHEFLERLPEIQRQLLEAETAPERAFADFMARLMPIRMQLRAALRALKDDYEAMDEMGVHRASKRPKSRFLHVLFLLAFIVVEALINGSFLAVGSEGGLVAGWLMALGISAFNVFLLGFTFGAMGVRQLSHRRFYHKILGVLALIVVAVVGYSSNLLVAHYRDALGGSDPDNASAAALIAWLNNPVNPLKVTGAQSLWLLGLGFAFTVLGVIDGWLFDDPYPGYGRFYIEHEQRQENYQALYNKSFDDLRDVAQSQESRLSDLADDINRRLNDFLLLKARYASSPDDPDFAAWKQIEEGFPEVRVNTVLNQLRDKKGKIFDEYTSAMRGLEILDPTTGRE